MTVGTDDREQAGPDLDLRLIRYFVAVAEHGNFGRAADALLIAQPSLSRQIRRLEAQVGARLLDRTPRGSRLTAAGTAFLPQARALLRQARSATDAARAAAGVRTFTIGYTGGIVVSPISRHLSERFPGVAIATRRLPEEKPADALREGLVDGLVARLPLETDGLQVTMIGADPRALVVSVDHPLAARASVAPEDFEGDPRVSCASADADWTSFWRLEDDSPVPLSRLSADSFDDKLELVATRQAVAVLPEHDPRLAIRPDIVAIPIDGAPPALVAAATRDDDEIAREFHAAAQTYRWTPAGAAAALPRG
ncbi:LysR family transcriptional regulator [Puerhibacterium puerhi]|uniref:LysR family transcriptional regulator n=1 Tax=Puerhibacterium puerhi TaxID=2692623 RepID=UPI00135CC5AB|nr:LysR family transcriptional regulator [Puerhibacterium puerhi]